MPMRWALAGLVTLTMTAPTNIALAGEIRVLCSNGMKAAMDDLVSPFERATKHTVAIDYGVSADLKRQIDKSAPFDLAILTPALIDELIAQGRIAPDTRVTLARSSMALAIRAGTPKPDIRTTDALTRVLRSSTSISYAREGASSVFFAQLVQRLNLAEALTSTTRLTATGAGSGGLSRPRRGAAGGPARQSSRRRGRSARDVSGRGARLPGNGGGYERWRSAERCREGTHHVPHGTRGATRAREERHGARLTDARDSEVSMGVAMPGRVLVLLTLLTVTAAAQSRRPLELANATVPAGARRISEGSDPLQFGELRVPAAKGPHPVAIVIHGGCWVSKIENMDAKAVLNQVWTTCGRGSAIPGGHRHLEHRISPPWQRWRWLARDVPGCSKRR